MAFRFVALTESDLPLIARWLAEPHVAEWWGPVEAELPNIEAAIDLPLIEPYRVDLDGHPIAYLQCYAVGPHSLEALRDQPPGTRGLDLFIGEADCIDRGLGTALIRDFARQLFRDPAVPRLILDCNESNARAVRCYEKAGFRRAGVVAMPWGTALLMILESPRAG